MGDYVDGTLYIGGRIHRSQLPRLVSALQMDLCEHFNDTHLLRAPRVFDGSLSIEAPQVPDGEFRSLGELRALGLTVMAVRGAGDNYPVATFYASPDLPHIVVIREADYEPFVSLSGLERALEQGHSLRDVIASITPPFIAPPPFEITDASLADIGSEGALAAAQALLGGRP